MIAIKEIREFTGLSQYKLAEWLGVSRALVHFAENGKRELPHKASMKINAMTLLLQQIKAGKEIKAVKLNVTVAEKLASIHKKKMEAHQKAAASLNTQLNKLEKVHPKINSRLAMMDALSNNDIEWFTKTEPDKKWIELTEWFTKERLKTNGEEEQEILKDKIDIQLSYAEIHKKHWQKFSTI